MPERVRPTCTRCGKPIVGRVWYSGADRVHRSCDALEPTPHPTDPVLDERERCARLVVRYLQFDSQDRTPSWHEVQDCIKAIRGGK